MTQPPVFPHPEYSKTVGFENFDLLFDRYAPCLYGIIFRAVNGNAAIAETLTGQAFVKIYRNRHLYDPARQRLLVWMISMAMALIKEQGYYYKMPLGVSKTVELDTDNLEIPFCLSINV